MDEREYIVKNYYEGGILKTRCDVEKIPKKLVVFIVLTLRLLNYLNLSKYMRNFPPEKKERKKKWKERLFFFSMSIQLCNILELAKVSNDIWLHCWNHFWNHYRFKSITDMTFINLLKKK